MLLLTGPTGNVGAEVVRLLFERTPALPYRIAAHHPQRLQSRYGPQVPALRFDYDDRSTWGPVLQGHTTLFLLFPVPQPRTVRTRMKPFIDAAVEAGCRHIVYLSVPGAETYSFVPHHMTLVYTLTRQGRNELQVQVPLSELLGRPATTLRQFVADNRWRWERQEWT